MKQCVERAIISYLTWWHGRGEATQYEYYRCEGCLRIVTWKAIRKGGCTCGMSHKVCPARLTWFEKARLILVPFLGVVR